MRKHKQERKFKCIFENCNYAAKSNSNLKRHILCTHNQERKFKCTFEGCDYSAHSNSNLSRHMLNKHTQEKKFKCDFQNCNYSAKTNVSLKKHMIYVHSKDKFFKYYFDNFKAKDNVHNLEIYKDVKEPEKEVEFVKSANNKEEDVKFSLLEGHDDILALIEENKESEAVIALNQDFELNEKKIIQDYGNIDLQNSEKEIEPVKNVNNEKENIEFSFLDEDYESILALLEEYEKLENTTEFIQNSELNEKDSFQDYENILLFSQDNDLNFDF